MRYSETGDFRISGNTVETLTQDFNIQAASNLINLESNVTITGNLDVSGNLNYQNVEDLYVTDQKITLNANAATDATVEIIANRPVIDAINKVIFRPNISAK